VVAAANVQLLAALLELAALAAAETVALMPMVLMVRQTRVAVAVALGQPAHYARAALAVRVLSSFQFQRDCTPEQPQARQR
jgi:hypothetical protein